MKKSCLCLVVLVMAAAVSALGAPNLSGGWKANIEKSDFGPFPPPYELTEQIEHKDPSLKITWHLDGEQGEDGGVATFMTDGTETVNLFGDLELTSVVIWEGDLLKFKSRGLLQGSEAEFEESWTVSEDGKTITVNRRMSSVMGEAKQKLVLERK